MKRKFRISSKSGWTLALAALAVLAITFAAPVTAGAAVVDTTDFSGDAGTPPTGFGSYWVFSNTGTGSWLTETTTTASGSVGPCGPLPSPGDAASYAFTEASSSAGPDFYATSPTLPLDAYIYTIDFWYDKHHNGTTTCNLYVEYSAAGDFSDTVDLGIVSPANLDDGTMPSSCSPNPWRNATIDLTSYTSSTAKIRFHVNTNQAYQCDVALDYIVTDRVTRCSATAPSDLAGSDAAGEPVEVDLTWTYDGTNNNYYTVYRDSVMIANNITTGSYTDSTVSPSTTYDYTVRGYNTGEGCQSGDSNTANVTTNACSDPDPATMTMTAPSGGATIGGTYIFAAQVGTEPGANMLNVEFYINGAWKSGAVWNSTSSRWEYTSNTVTDYPGSDSSPITDSTVKVRGNDPNCSQPLVESATVSPDISVDNTDPYKIMSCAGCHRDPPADGTRSGSTGAVVGSHGNHVTNASIACTACHIDNGTPASSFPQGLGHRTGIINMAAAINGGSYGGGTSIAQTESPSLDTCDNTYCHSTGIGGTNNSGEDRSVPSNSSPTWGDTGDGCETCHGAEVVDGSGQPAYANATLGSPGTLKANSHTSHTPDCSVCHNATTTDGGNSITSPANHINKVYNVVANAAASFSYSYDVTGGTCNNISCHADGSAQWGTSVPCTDCHSSTITRTQAAGTLDDVVSEFGLAWGHKRSGRGTVTASDCIVCHLEGVYATQKTSQTYHMDGNIDLRDPDGAGETPITDNGDGAFTFTKFSMNFTTRNTAMSNSIADVITQKFCIACHDSDGATNTTARTTYGTPSAAMPFGGIALGANYTAVLNSIGTQGLIDVKNQFDPTNPSRHPVMASNTRDFPYSTSLIAPYDNIGTARDSNGTTGHVTAQSVVMSCFDCHNVSGASPLTDRTVAAHGDAETVRGDTYVAGSTSLLCFACHSNTGTRYLSTSNYHGTGSAWATQGSSHNSVMGNCHFCHGGNTANTSKPARPQPAQDYHGNKALVGGGLWPTVNSRPYAFIRAWRNGAYHRPYRSSEFTSGSATCGAATNSCNNGNRVGNGTTRTYTPGGTY